MTFLALALLVLRTGTVEITIDGSKDGAVTQGGLTVELKWEKPEAQRLTVRGTADTDVVVRVHPRLVPKRVLYKAEPVKRAVGDWVELGGPQWRTVEDVLHFELRVPKALLGAAPTFTLTGRSSADDVVRAQGLIDFVKRIRSFLDPDDERALDEVDRKKVGELAMRHAVKVDSEESSAAVGEALRRDFDEMFRTRPNGNFVRAALGLRCEFVPDGPCLRVTAAWPFVVDSVQGIMWDGERPFESEPGELGFVRLAPRPGGPKGGSGRLLVRCGEAILVVPFEINAPEEDD